MKSIVLAPRYPARFPTPQSRLAVPTSCRVIQAAPRSRQAHDDSPELASIDPPLPRLGPVRMRRRIFFATCPRFHRPCTLGKRTLFKVRESLLEIAIPCEEL